MKIDKIESKKKIIMTNEITGDYVRIFAELDSLMFVFSTDKPFVISSEDDKYLHYALTWLLTNDYQISEYSSYKTSSSLIYCSDGAKIDKKNVNNYGIISISKLGNQILLKCCSNNTSKDNPTVVSFNFRGLGFDTINNQTGFSLQEDLLYAFFLALNPDNHENLYNSYVSCSMQYKLTRVKEMKQPN